MTLAEFLELSMPFRFAAYERLLADLNEGAYIEARNAARRAGEPRIYKVDVAAEHREDHRCVGGLCGAIQVNGRLLLCLACALEAREAQQQ